MLKHELLQNLKGFVIRIMCLRNTVENLKVHDR